MNDPAGFVRANTSLIAPPLVPEIRLHLATELVPIWRSTEEELAEAGVPPPYWAFAWAGGQALARYVLDHPQTIRGRAVLDFGAGSGLIAIAAARAGAGRVVAADIDAFAIAAIAMNAEENGVAVAITTRDVIGETGIAETILVGDMCYERPLADRVLNWLAALKKDGAAILIGDPGRTYFPKKSFERLATYFVKTTRELEDREIRETGVYRLV